MKNVWKLEDIIDLEYLTGLDLFTDGSEAEMHQRDRSIFLETLQKGELEEGASHQQYLAAWLARRRSSESNAPRPFLPGEKLRGALHIFSLLLLVSGLATGYGTGLSYFAYTGSTPLNVFTFFIIFLLPQLLLIVIFLLKKSVAGLTRNPHVSLSRTLQPLFTGFVRFAQKKGPGDLSDEQRKSYNLLFTEKNRRLFSRSLFVRGQLFGISFNISLLSVTLFKIATADLAFGWQTTLRIGADGLHGLVQFLALPWSWLLPAELASPSLAQIEGSRIILKEGIYHLLTEDLTSWWPFLLMSLVVYGLLPRLLLLVYGVFMEKRNMTRLLRQRKFQAVTSRMRTRLVTSQAAEESPVDVDRAAHRILPAEQANGIGEPAEALILIPEEASELFDDHALAGLLLIHGYRPVERRILFKTYEEDQSIIAGIGHHGRAVIILFEAWMPPIREHLLFLKQLSAALEPGTDLAVYLLGKPAMPGVLMPPKRQETQLWREKIGECCDVAAVFHAGSSPDTTGERGA